MKKWICLLVCMLLAPACALAEKPFPVDAESFQWHLSDMLERYIVWESMGEVNGKEELFGYAADGMYPDFTVRLDADGKLYAAEVSAILNPSYDQYTLESMDAVLDGAQTAAHTIGLLTNGSLDIEDPFLTGDVHSLHRDVRSSQNLSRHTGQKTFFAPGIQCVQKLELVTPSRMFYSIRFEPR